MWDNWLNTRRYSLYILCLCASISGAQIDTLSIQDDLRKANSIMFSEPEPAVELFNRAIRQSDSIQYDYGKHHGLVGLGVFNFYDGNYDTSLDYFNQALDLAESMDYTAGIGNCYLKMGIVLYVQGEPNKATEEYLKSLEYFYIIKDTATIISTHQNLGLIFSDLGQFDKSNTYINTALELATLTQDSLKIAANALNLGRNYSKTEAHEQALEQFNLARPIVESSGDLQLLYHLNQNLAQYYLDVEELDHALDHIRKAYDFIKTLDSKMEIAFCLDLMAEIYLARNNIEHAQKYYQEAHDLAEAINASNHVVNSSLGLSRLFARKNDYRQAYGYAEKYIVMYDSIVGDKNRKVINDMEAKYEFEKQNNEILQQQLEIEQNEALLQRQINRNGLYVMGIIVLLFVSFLLWYRQRQKRKLHRQSIETLNREKELAELEALIEGEDLERSRIAKDLHDSVNGNLSAIKHSLSAISKQQLSKDDHESYNLAVGMLDQACEQVRNISHNLAPPSLLNYGLVEAIEQYVSRINTMETVAIAFQHFGTIKPLTKKVESTIYNIVQELITNIVKHSGAKTAMVQLNAGDDSIHITVEDDGSGYDTGAVTHGLGLNNIKSRVDFLNADYDISSDARGTSVIINLGLSKIPQL